jgi:ubiquinone/menaquinone biosynthesis C-methylase UbiE
MSGPSAARLAAVIDELARAHRAAVPPPRGLPYLGLEHASGTGWQLLDALAARGIFRKYELVLDLGGALGGTSRWLAARLGCEVVVTATDAVEAAAAADLTRRAGLAAEVRLLAADPGALPVRSGAFTHVWIVESLPRMADPDAALGEGFRALRRGGTLALQELATATPAAAIRGWRLASADGRVAALRRAGFVDLEVRDRTAEATERSAQMVAARAQLLRRLRSEPDLASVLAEREALAAALGAGALRVVQFLARRP